MSIINKFKISSEIDENTSKIKLFHLTTGDLLFVTLNGGLFQYNLTNERLRNFTPKKRKREFIIKFACSSTHYMALHSNGFVYGWGENIYGQLGNASDDEMVEVPQMNEIFLGLFITDICCSATHSLALTRDGDVFAFGDNSALQCGNNSAVRTQLIPFKIDVSNVQSISCGNGHSIAVTESGVVYGWGATQQLGIVGVSNNRLMTPTPLTVPLVKQVICGLFFTAVLSRDGDIYICGKLTESLSHSIPTKINSTTKFNRIAASIHSRLCVALSVDNQCFIYGSYGDVNNEIVVKELQQTEFTSIEETYAFYEQITYTTINIPRIKTTEVLR